MAKIKVPWNDKEIVVLLFPSFPLGVFFAYSPECRGSLIPSSDIREWLDEKAEEDSVLTLRSYFVRELEKKGLITQAQLAAILEWMGTEPPISMEQTKEEIIALFKAGCCCMDAQQRRSALYFQYNRSIWEIDDYEGVLQISKPVASDGKATFFIKAWRKNKKPCEFELTKEEFEELEKAYFGEYYEEFSKI